MSFYVSEESKKAMRSWLDDWAKDLAKRLEKSGAVEHISPEEQTMRILKDPLDGSDWIDDDD